MKTSTADTTTNTEKSTESETPCSCGQTHSSNDGSKTGSTFPHLVLEFAEDDSSLARITFQPDPDTWVFDDTRGTRDQLRADLNETADFVLKSLPPDAPFDQQAKQVLRTRILFVLLQWTTFRGLVIPAGR